MQKGEERREYFRIKNWIILDHEAIDSLDEINNDDAVIDHKASQMGILQQLNVLTKESEAYLNSLDDKQSQLGDSLINLNKRVDLLTQFAIQTLHRDQKNLTEVDISGGGLRFKSTENYPIDQLIKLDIVLIPECVAIEACARVVYCVPFEEAELYEVALTFVQLSESDRDAIIKHIFAIQSKQLREQDKESIENND
jgi:hypothetical protein